tara:strand:- start:163 stop:453 length:291 start_codon:yes stop_codon:yes gene_type:complete
VRARNVVYWFKNNLLWQEFLTSFSLKDYIYGGRFGSSEIFCSSGVLSLCPCFLPASLLLPKSDDYFSPLALFVCSLPKHRKNTRITNEQRKKKRKE